MALSACAAPSQVNYESTSVAAPTWRAGDRWTFRGTDGYNGLPRGVITRAVQPGPGRGFYLLTTDDQGRVLDRALLEAPGILLSGSLSVTEPFSGVFSPPLRKYDFPLVSGKEWRQRITHTDADGVASYVELWSRVEGWQEVLSPGGSFHAIVVRRLLQLGPTAPYYGVLYREETDWYAPELSGPAHMRVYERYKTERFWFKGAFGDYLDYALDSYRLA